MIDTPTRFDRSLGSLKNLFITELAKHRRHKKVLRGPFHILPGKFEFASWKDHALPLYSWAAVSTVLFDREEYLAIFREIAGRAKHRHDKFGDEIYLNHEALKTATNIQFDFIFAPLLDLKDLRSQFSKLSILSSLPDRDHWARYTAIEDDNDLSVLASAYAQCFNHQSQAATDIRWLIVMNFIANDKMRFSSHLEERYRTIIEYPNRGDMRSVRPAIRAIEISLRGDPTEKDSTLKNSRYEAASEEIWNELFAGTNCMPLALQTPEPLDHRKSLRELMDVYKRLVIHYFDNVGTTGIDPKLDSAFGLVLYALALLAEAASLRPYQRISAKLLLRTILESHINLRFLTTKDDRTVWLQYRNHGSAQAKLAFLKYLEAEQMPEYVNIQELYELANEDMWIEYQDINLGSWANKSLRDIANEAGLKEVYDQHYIILSTAIHAQWSAVRETNFTQCVNPLHRYHRVPDSPRVVQENLIPEMAKLINQMLDDLNHLYPQFKDRLRAHRSIKSV